MCPLQLEQSLVLVEVDATEAIQLHHSPVVLEVELLALHLSFKVDAAGDQTFHIQTLVRAMKTARRKPHTAYSKRYWSDDVMRHNFKRLTAISEFTRKLQLVLTGKG